MTRSPVCTHPVQGVCSLDTLRGGSLWYENPSFYPAAHGVLSVKSPADCSLKRALELEPDTMEAIQSRVQSEICHT